MGRHGVVEMDLDDKMGREGKTETGIDEEEDGDGMVDLSKGKNVLMKSDMTGNVDAISRQIKTTLA